MGHRFTAILAAEWQGLIDRSCNSKRPLVFSHAVLTKKLGIRRAQAIRAQITRWMDLWERGLHAGLVGNAEVEGAAREVRANREGRAARGGDKEDEVVARSYHDMVLSSKLLQAVCRATHREGVGYLLPDYGTWSC